MNVRAKILIAAFLVASPSDVDVIVMSNGDHITGEIKGLNAGVLRVDLDYVDGSVSLQWMKVARIESPNCSSFTPLAHTDRLTSSVEAQQNQLADIQQSMVTIEQLRIVRLDETDHNFLRRWSGELNLGLVYSKGNNSTQNTFGFEVNTVGKDGAILPSIPIFPRVAAPTPPEIRSISVGIIFYPGRTTITANW